MYEVLVLIILLAFMFHVFSTEESTDKPTNSPLGTDCIDDWGTWSPCSADCTRTRLGSCGVNVQTQSCTATDCPVSCDSEECSEGPVNCTFGGDWSTWSMCNAQPCGSGTRQRTRTITQHPENGGDSCAQTMYNEDGVLIIGLEYSNDGGQVTQTQECTSTDCPVSCQPEVYTSFSPFNACVCPDGSRSRRLSVPIPGSDPANDCVRNLAAQDGFPDQGQPNNTPGTDGYHYDPVTEKIVHTQSCECPTECQLGHWSAWSTECDCDSPYQSRYIDVVTMPNGESMSLHERRDACRTVVDTLDPGGGQVSVEHFGDTAGRFKETRTCVPVGCVSCTVGSPGDWIYNSDEDQRYRLFAQAHSTGCGLIEVSDSYGSDDAYYGSFQSSPELGIHQTQDCELVMGSQEDREPCPALTECAFAKSGVGVGLHMEWDFDHWYHYALTNASGEHELRWTKSNRISDTDAHTDAQCIAAARRYDGTVGNDAVHYSINIDRGERHINKFVYSSVDAQTYGVPRSKMGDCADPDCTNYTNGTCYDEVQMHDWSGVSGNGPGCALYP